MSRQPPGTSKTMAISGACCGIRPDLEAMTDDTGFDFSAAAGLLPEAEPDDQSDSDYPAGAQHTIKSQKKDAK